MSDLVKRGHDKAAQLKSSGGAVSQLISDLATQLDVQLARSNALAAENAGLKSAIDATIGWQQSTDPENVESVRMLVDVKTPVTDAFLAEVRAQGVEMFAEHKRERQQALRSRSMRMSEEAACMAADAENFADELREGVLS
ncbi:hypothetical protein [Enterobacter hormaechei]|uniref:hypothetical protein n=1 Tax=Enterobacter hormaechei TaxID=158836 RepID=UPI003F56B8B2